jgi:allophanate hydrolase
MAQAVFRVVAAGPLVSVQDAGRRGSLRFGVPGSGPMDRKSLAIANGALGNPPGAAGIEVSRGGLVLKCEAGAVSVAIAGGGFAVQAGDARLGSWAVVTLRAGERLTIGQGPWGSWTAVAFAGDMQVHHWLGSAATHALSGFGGGMLRAGQQITVTQAQVVRDGAIPCPVWARPREVIHAVPGPQDRCFAASVLEAFFAAPFWLTDAYDRMGVRLRGPDLAPKAALNLPSEAVMRGSVQVAGDGVPTVLLADHQTTGGYPKIATILSDDLDGFAQLRPHDAVRFVRVGADQAVQIARQRARAVARYLQALAARL